MPNDILKALASLPKSMSETYKRVLDSIPQQDLEHSKRLLAFLTYSTRPLYIWEAVDILAISFQEIPKFHRRYRMPHPQRVVKFCSSLVAFTEDQQIKLSHFSVQEYLTSNEDKGRFSHDLEPSVAQSSITEVLTAYLLSIKNYQDNWSGFKRSDHLHKIRDRFPLLQYCSGHLFYHARYVQETSGFTQQCILECLSSRKAWGLLLWSSNQDHGGELDRLFNPALWESRLVVHLEPLYVVCVKGMRHTAQLLLEQGADVNALCGKFGTPLQAACSLGNSEVAKLLIEWGADVDLKFTPDGEKELRTALVPAILNGMTDVVKLLLERGADPNIASVTAFTNIRDYYPLSAASGIGSREMVEALLDHGADPQRCHFSRGTALMNACYEGHTAVAELLINSGAIIDLVVEAFQINTSVQPLNDITYLGAMWSCTALKLACYSGHVGTVKVLIRKGADVNLSGDHDTALTIARSRRHERVVQILLKHGARDRSMAELELARLRSAYEHQSRMLMG